MKKGKERRRRARWDVAVLVRCSIPKLEDELVELEMWAKDVNEDGLKLEVSKGLHVSRVSTLGEENNTQPVRYEDIDFKKGAKVKIQDLFYDDDGSPFINGKVMWARRQGQGGWTIGVKLSDENKSKVLAGAYKDFLSIVKNPLDAIRKASRK